MLLHFDPDKETWIETDASDYVVTAVMSQRDEHGVLRPVTFLSKKMSPAECNYEIYDKELLTIVRAFEEWHPELAGTPVEDPIQIITDHKNLQYFMDTKQLNRRQARWTEFLSEFNFKITYRPGRLDTKPDSLTRRPSDLPEDETDPRTQFQHQTILKTHNLEEGMRHAVDLAKVLIDEVHHDVVKLAVMMYSLSEVEVIEDESLEDSLSDDHENIDEKSINEASTDQANTGPELMKLIRSAYENDDLVQRIILSKQRGDRRLPLDIIKDLKLELGDCSVTNKLLYVKDPLFVPNSNETLRTRVIKGIHESPPGGHAGRTSTYDRVSRYYYWPRMTDSVSRYVKSCHTCKRSKSYKDGKQELLKPLPIPDRY